MRRNVRSIYINPRIYEGLLELKKVYKLSFGGLIEKFCPMPFHSSPISLTPPIEKKKVSKKIPKRKKYSYAEDLADFEAHKCKSLNLKPMKPTPERNKQVLKAEYTPDVQEFLLQDPLLKFKKRRY
jgi:hypothetical protein